ncbi:cbb3-type cytochrome c oxidase N-terminal domain-containing protein [Flammeovirga sp. EKP202]|uniref:cbb3-type cytochrome c oxidase N-terminal domain-containing protein n=1 Tax=Flammeovirga sp. EKP202 TaxID=2770592 RepID=UPI00165EC6FC|nr:cbb3-type cytochrome c oxidase N-terminal domain-containing protein [Flammeovirga sp. EKP202]MBD0404865.1 c-type cytochrome [Flammeovirga sp. EKP202]
MKSANKKILSLLALTLTGNAAWASDQLIYGLDNFDLLIYVLGSVLVLLFFAILIIALGLLFIVKESLKKAPKTAEDVAFEMEGETGWKGFLARINAAKPIALEKDIIMDHNYDGIQELDNDLPPWWKALFYACIVIAFGYLGVYHWWAEADGEPVSIAEYHYDVEQAEIAKKEYLATMANAIDETNVEVAVEASALASGKKAFDANCKACHGGAGEGGVGPNLTDEYWLHGGDVKSIFKTIKYGVPAKGMLAWEAKLTPLQIQEVSSYILSLQGTNPPNGKAPQGEKVAM